MPVDGVLGAHVDVISCVCFGLCFCVCFVYFCCCFVYFVLLRMCSFLWCMCGFVSAHGQSWNFETATEAAVVTFSSDLDSGNLHNVEQDEDDPVRCA